MSSRLQQRMNDDSGDDSDVQEIAIVLTKNGPRRSQDSPPPPPKRRKSSPQIDPIPSYSPTPLHELESSRDHTTTTTNWARPTAFLGLNFDYGHISYEPTPLESSDREDSPPVHGGDDETSSEYVPLLGPSPSVVGGTRLAASSPVAAPASRSATTTRHGLGTSPNTTATYSSTTTTIIRPRRVGGGSSSTPRPVSSALAQAVARRRSSQQGSATLITKTGATRSVSALQNNDFQESLAYAEKPVMWSPQMPSQIKPINDEEAVEKQKQLEDEQHAICKAPRPAKQRVAHKPTIPRNNKNRPKMPLGTSRKVPLQMRVKYLEVIGNEYLNTGHEEEESYQRALNEEQALAARAANKNIYVNLVASLKKKIREQAGISTKPPDDEPTNADGTKVLSHEEILTGKVHGTFSIERKRKSSDPSELNEHELYDRLSRYMIPFDDLEAYGYPCRDPDEPDKRKVPILKNGQKPKLREQLATSYTCDRCMKVYRVNEMGMPCDISKCIFHPGHLWNERINRALEKRYSCCKGDSASGGCSSNGYHVHKGEFELENYRNYVETEDKPDRNPNKHGLYALDCEMCYTTYGLELSRVTVINYKFEVVYDELVRPTNPILDYNTKYSGIEPGDLDDVSKTLADVQQELLDLFSSRTILIGHSLDSDMKALKIFHQYFIDTAQLFPHKRGLPYKRALRTLMVENLRVIIQEDNGHDSKEDASAAFRLVMWKAKTDVPPKA